PDGETLGRALRAISDQDSWRQRFDVASVTSWPLASCLRSADDPDTILSYATLAESGELGELDDWLLAELDWHTGVNEKAVLAAAERFLPWRRDTLAKVQPLGGFAQSVLSWLDGRGKSVDVPVAQIELLNKVARRFSVSYILARIASPSVG